LNEYLVLRKRCTIIKSPVEGSESKTEVETRWNGGPIGEMNKHCMTHGNNTQKGSENHTEAKAIALKMTSLSRDDEPWLQACRNLAAC
jgi:hypothetical protein